MSIVEELAAARASAPAATHAELIEAARFEAEHPDGDNYRRPVLLALLREIELGKQRLAMAIKYGALQRHNVRVLLRRIP